MKTLTKKNLIKFLVKHGACQPGLDWAQSQDTARDIVEKCPEDRYLHWLIGAIGGLLETEFSDKHTKIWAEYNRQLTPLYADGYEVPPIRAEYWDEVVKSRYEYNNKCNTIAKEICTFERVQESIGS